MGKRFQTTRWSVVLRAGAADGEPSREALAELCEAYWYPVYGFVRGQGYREEDARDMTQAYFATLLDRGFLRDLRPELGRFRAFLFVSIRNFLSQRREHDRALKRGGRQQPVSLDVAGAEERLAAERSGERSPEQAFEIRWARTVVRRTLERLEQEFAASDQGERFAVLRGFLTGDAPTLPYGEIAKRLEVGENAVRPMVRRLRQRFGIALRAEVAQTIDRREAVDEELRYLLRVLESR